MRVGIHSTCIHTNIISHHHAAVTSSFFNDSKIYSYVLPFKLKVAVTSSRSKISKANAGHIKLSIARKSLCIYLDTSRKLFPLVVGTLKRVEMAKYGVVYLSR